MAGDVEKKFPSLIGRLKPAPGDGANYNGQFPSLIGRLKPTFGSGQSGGIGVSIPHR